MRAICVEPALAVIRQDHSIAAAQHASHNPRAWTRSTSWLGVRFEIDPQQLLLAADHAQLDGGGDAGVMMQAHRNAVLLQQLPQARARLVAADHRQQRDPRAERRGVARDVGRAARTLLDAV